jgi:GNAT superfamily N-acetyltransferase
LKVDIGLLADHDDFVPILAQWFYQEWGWIVPTFTLQHFEEELRQRQNRDRLPLAVVAFCNGRPIATASLVLHEMETHLHYLHWIAGVYTLPEYRRRGIGSQLVEFAVAEAKHLEVRELYLYTRGSESLYASLGWEIIEEPMYQGRIVSIMRRVL